MSSFFLTTGKAKKVRRKPKKAEPDIKYFDYQDAITAFLKQFGMKMYYAQLATIDFREIVINGYQDKEAVDVVALRVLLAAQQSYTGKVMVKDGSCIYSGTV